MLQSHHGVHLESASGGDVIGVTIEDKDTGYAQFIKSLDNLKRHPSGAIDVGWFVPEVAWYALLNELGTEDIPPRSFIRTTVDENMKRYMNQMTRVAVRITDEGLDPEKALLPVGNQLRNDIIKKIISLRSPENKQSTIDSKGSSNPLVDTGQMQRTLQIRGGAKK